MYISHRLASTRFCDRICLLEGGRIIEEGTHDDLMERKGRYARIYEIQSQYYRQRDERKRAGGAMGDAPSRQEEREGAVFMSREDIKYIWLLFKEIAAREKGSWFTRFLCPFWRQ